MKSENQKLATSLVDIISAIANSKYNNSIYQITSTLGDNFRRRDLLLDIGEINSAEADVIKYWSPISFTKYRVTEQTIETRLELTRHVFEDAAKYCSNDRLTCIGNGCIDPGSIMVVGMTAGFRYANMFDEISFPYKFSFYFGDTSFLLREGMFDILSNVYFTNVGKYSFDRATMESGDMYIRTYDECFPILLREIEFIRPKAIMAAGTQVYDYLTKHRIQCHKITHPSYYLFKRKMEDGIKYYNTQARYIREEFL